MTNLIRRFPIFSFKTLASAILIVLAFPPFDFDFLIWFSLVPWLDTVFEAPTKKAAALQGLWLSILMSVMGFYFVAYVLVEYGNLPFWVGILGLLLYSFIGQPQFTLFAPVLRSLLHETTSKHFTSKNILVSMAITALAYSSLDWLLPKLFVDTLGHSLYQRIWLRQIADIGGPALITFVIVFNNLIVWKLYRLIRYRNEPSVLPALSLCSKGLLTAALLLISSSLYGRYRYNQIQAIIASPDTQTVRLAMIQANIGDLEKIAAEKGLKQAAREVMKSYYDLSEQASNQTPKPDGIIWPETAYPSTFRTPRTTEEFARDSEVDSFVKRTQATLLFGGYDRLNAKDHNAFFLLDPELNLQIYRKNLLLLFGEYIPGAELFPAIKNLFPQVGNFGRGVGPSVLELKTPNKPAIGSVKFSPIICYEALFPNYVLEGIRLGSEFILNVTNDSWFGPTPEAKLHLSLTTFRSIETRKAQVRATNTGISSMISPDGSILSPTPLGAAVIVPLDVPLMPPLFTLMLAWGDWFAPTGFAICLVYLTFTHRSQRSRQVSNH